MNRFLKKILAIAPIFALTFAVSAMGNSANAVNDIYVNDGNSVINGDTNSVYAIGGDGSVSVVGDTYAITADGVLKIGEQTTPGVPGGEDDGTSVDVSYAVARIGLAYSSNALTYANLENAVGGGYQFGYYDSSRVFHALSSTNETRITMSAVSGGVQIARTGTSDVIYTYTPSNGTNLAVHPVSYNGKALTWFKGNRYYGDFEYNRVGGASSLTVINVVDVEDYIKGVLPFEMSTSWPVESLKAQALCARTYFATNINRYSRYGFDITNDTRCQAYKGRGGSNKSESYYANSDRAVEETKNEFVTYNGRLCTTLYYASNGGGSEDSQNVFGGTYHYLQGVIDPFEKDVPASVNTFKSWTKTYTGDELAGRVNNKGYSLSTVVSVSPTYSDTNNVIAIKFTDKNGKTATFSGTNSYNFCYGSGLSLRSIHFKVVNNGSSFAFNGSGWGHSVGMSQWGAYSMAKYHDCNYRQIIRFYYTDACISKGY